MIHITGSYTLEASRETVWPRIFDPHELMGLIPGCQQLEKIGEQEYNGQIQVGVAGVGGIYEATVRVVDAEPPERCRFQGEITGRTGSITGEAIFTLEEVNGNSLIEYTARAIITGALAKLSPRFIEGVVNALIRIGLGNLNRQLHAQAEADPSPDSARSVES